MRSRGTSRAEIGDEMAQVVFLLRADGAVGEEHERALPREAAHRVVGVDPRVHALRRARARRAAAAAPRANDGRRRTAERGENVSSRCHGSDRLTIQCARDAADAAARALARVPSLPFAPAPTPVEPLPRLSALLGGGPRLFVKRDDAIPFGFGGNKVRKLALVAARAVAEGADTLITAGGVQSNHARATAAAAAKLGMRAVLVANGAPRRAPTGNALLDALLGAEVVYVAVARGARAEDARDRRAPARRRAAGRSRSRSARRRRSARSASCRRSPSCSIRCRAPDVIVHATSSGGTQAGLVAGCRLLGLSTRVIGDQRGRSGRVASGAGAADRQRHRRSARRRSGTLLARGTPIEVDDRFVGDGYGIPTDASREAIELAARTEAIFLDPTYTAKAMAGLIAVRPPAAVQGRTDGAVLAHRRTGGAVRVKRSGEAVVMSL